MKQITQEEYDALPIIDGVRQCPGNTDYRLVASFGAEASFGERAHFGAEASFGERAHFGAWASFGAWAHFGAWASFGAGASFGAEASFGAGASIEGHKIRAGFYPFLSIAGAGSENRTTYFIFHEDMVRVRSGCFFGTLDEFRAKVLQDCQATDIKAIQYLGMADIAEATFNQAA